MIGKQVIEDRDVTLTEVNNVLTKRKKEGELSYEQKLAFDYSSEFGTLKVTSARELVESLMKIEGMDVQTAVQIADNQPVDKADLAVIFEKRRKGFSEGESKKILDLVSDAKK
jgi:DNA-directed RNA polymerase subunit F